VNGIPGSQLHTFEEVARLVCKGTKPAEGLAGHFRFWAWPMEGVVPEIPRQPTLTRKQAVSALGALKAAADVIVAGLTSGPLMAFVMGEKYDLFDRVTLLKLLSELSRRCEDSATSEPLTSADGRVRRGPGAIASPHKADPRTYCASVILLAWREIHGSYPGSRNPSATQAAEAFFCLASAPAGQPQLQRRNRSKKGDPLTAWRRPFENARANEPVLGALQGIYLRHLRAALGLDEPSMDTEGRDETR
jgi:hypothetical protein